MARIEPDCVRPGLAAALLWERSVPRQRDLRGPSLGCCGARCNQARHQGGLPGMHVCAE